MTDKNGESVHDTERETHIDDDLGIWVPQDLREFTGQIVFRTPRATIQHFGTGPLDGYYGMIDRSHFGDQDDLFEPQNPELAPDRITIKPQGEDAVTLSVETRPEIRTDGGTDVGATEHNFPFEVGEEVLVRVRENGTSGNIVAKFEAECAGMTNSVGHGSAKARFEFDWGTMNSVTLRSYEAEFEVIS